MLKNIFKKFILPKETYHISFKTIFSGNVIPPIKYFLS